MAKRKSHPGLSPFTHRDDITAGVHPTHPDHQDALFSGTEGPPVHHAEIIMGPGPFGSPDPRTLAHRMNPSDADRPVSAPALDPAFHEAQGTDEVVNWTDEEVLSMTKAELADLARDNGIKVKSSDTREEILGKLGYGEDGESDDEGDDDGEEDEGESDSDDDDGDKS